MTQKRLSPSRSWNPKNSGGADMRLVVPLQGVVQGRGGLILGSLIPCALFYFLQFYLKRHRSPPSLPSSDVAPEAEITRTTSRSNLSSRGSIGRPYISSRAAPIARPTDSPYYIGLERTSEDAYDDVENPNGIIQLGLSENRLSLDLIENWVSLNWNDYVSGEVSDDGLIINGIATYHSFDGLWELKVAMAGFMSKVMGVSSSGNFDPSRIVLTAGATPALEILCFCLADHGSAFLVPTPYYPGFDRDMKWRTGVELIPVHCRSSDNFTLSITALDQAFHQARKRGQRVRGILISNPSNPVGTLLSRETLSCLLDFAREKNIHIISDEIFAGSIYGNEEFTSMAEIIDSEEFDKDRVHIIYGLSKDLCLPGFRTGVIYSWNENVMIASKRMARFCSVSVPTQKLLVAILSDAEFIDSYIVTNKERIGSMYELFVAALKELGIPCMKSCAGLYCWADLRSFVRPYSEKGEVELWEKLLNIGKVNLTPGMSCHCIEPGWFRCCFAALSEKDIPIVVERIRKVIKL